MKLRNKKTGAVANYSIILQRETGNGSNKAPIRYGCGTLAKLNEDWEDYKPAEPQIADEMAREIIKKWYNKNKIVGKLCSYGGKDWLGLRGSNSVGIDWKIELRVSYKSSLKYDELYSLTELIGEEE